MILNVEVISVYNFIISFSFWRVFICSIDIMIYLVMCRSTLSKTTKSVPICSFLSKCHVWLFLLQWCGSGIVCLVGVYYHFIDGIPWIDLYPIVTSTTVYRQFYPTFGSRDFVFGRHLKFSPEGVTLSLVIRIKFPPEEIVRAKRIYQKSFAIRKKT